ncbi:acyl transferase/acyl hydrolase/lysophospholipase [Ochromonadaceae sp. CCMP2298]|nr:acyl transferase/acyl hydrolase/lysophospholipase [Ochromonadaceae sp. CCMP2298]
MTRLFLFCWVALSCVADVLAYKIVRFSGGGIFFWWQAGAAKYVMKNCDLAHVPVMGASAGSVAAALMACDVDFDKAAELAIRIAHSRNVWDSKSGLAGIWGPMVEQFLQELLPDQLSHKALQKINVLVTPVKPRNLVRGPRLLNGFEGKADLIEALMASTHIPFFMNGKLTSGYKGKRYIDGSFWSMIAKVKGPFPAELQRELDFSKDVFVVDQNQDTVFMGTFEDSSITQLITPEGLYAMMDAGYSYMEKMHRAGLLTSGCYPSESESRTVTVSVSGRSGGRVRGVLTRARARAGVLLDKSRSSLTSLKSKSRSSLTSLRMSSDDLIFRV